MKKLAALILASAMISLSGCKEDLWILKFSEPVRNDREWARLPYSTLDILDTYKNEIHAIIRGRNLDPEHFELIHLEGKEGTILVQADTDAVPQKAIDLLERDLHEIVEARQKPMLSASLDISPQSPGKEQRLLFDREPHPSYKLNLDFKGEDIFFKTNLADHLFGAIIDPDAPRDEVVLCTAQAQLHEPLDFVNIKFEYANGKADGLIDIDSEMHQSNNIPAKLTFSDKQVQSLFEKGALMVTANYRLAPLENSSSTSKGLTDVYLHFAEFKKKTRTNNLHPWELEELKKQCRNEAKRVGRPFSFYLGDGLDRLIEINSLRTQTSP